MDRLVQVLITWQDICNHSLDLTQCVHWLEQCSFFPIWSNSYCIRFHRAEDSHQIFKVHKTDSFRWYDLGWVSIAASRFIQCCLLLIPFWDMDSNKPYKFSRMLCLTTSSIIHVVQMKSYLRDTYKHDNRVSKDKVWTERVIRVLLRNSFDNWYLRFFLLVINQAGFHSAIASENMSHRAPTINKPQI